MITSNWLIKLQLVYIEEVENNLVNVGNKKSVGTLSRFVCEETIPTKNYNNNNGILPYYTTIYALENGFATKVRNPTQEEIKKHLNL